MNKVVCIVSYSALSQISVTSIKWNNIVYDQIENLCELPVNISEHYFFSDLKICGVRIGLISDDSDFPSKRHCIYTFFRLFYSMFEVEEFMNELQIPNLGKTYSKHNEKLKGVILNHCIPLQRIIDSENSFQVIMCQLTQFQHSLHKRVINKLKKSLETNNLLDIVEAVCQDIQLSQHPYCFDYGADNGEIELFNSFRKKYAYEKSMPTYYLSNYDTLMIYLPKKIFSTLLSLRDFRCQRVSNYILPFNLLDFSFNKYERLQMKHLLISTTNIDNLLNKISACFSDTNEDCNHNLNTNEMVHESSNWLLEQKEFLSTRDLEILRSEFYRFSDVGSKNNLNSSNLFTLQLQNEFENENKDIQVSLTLAARRSKTKFKSRLTNLSKENEKYFALLDCSDSCYSNAFNILSFDVGIRINDLNCLQTLCSLQTNYISSTHRYRIAESKVISRSPKVFTYHKSKSLFNHNEQILLKKISHLFQVYLSTMPKVNSRLLHIQQDEVNLSGKLQALNSTILRLANDSSVKSCIILCHSFELLNMIETLIFINKNYGSFIKFRLNRSNDCDDEYIATIVEKFNKCQSRNQKAILLIHSRTDYNLINQLNVNSCSIIVTNSHWQIDSEQLILKLINRWSLNCIISKGNGISSIYKLCSFETLEQYFLTNDLSFLYENSYGDKHDVLKTTSAVVSQQSLFKYFVDKLLSPLKKELISGFCVEDFQIILQNKRNLHKLSNESMDDVFNSFENAYDLLLLCNYQSKKKGLLNEFHPLTDTSNASLFIHRKRLQADNDCSNGSMNEVLKKMESYRVKRQTKLNHIFDFIVEQDSVLFYDQEQLQFQNSEVWMPPQLNDSTRFVPAEISDMYDLNPIKDTEFSLHLLPTKSYPTKPNQKKWDDKASNFTIKEDILMVAPDYLEADRVKKRKLSNDYSLGDYGQYPIIQKKRKIFTNRRYIENENDVNSSQINVKSRYKIEKKHMNDSDVSVTDAKEISDIKKPPVACEQLSMEINNLSSSTVNHSNNQNPNNATHLNDVGKSNSVILCTNDNLIKINLQRPFYSKEGLKALKIKRQQISTGNISNLPTKTSVVSGSNTQTYVQQQRLPNSHRSHLFPNAKLATSSETASLSNGETEYEKLPEWNIHEEAVLYQNISHYQDHQLSNVSDKANSTPNFKICEHFLNFYSITNTHRRSEMCNIHFTKLQMGFINQSKGDNNISRLNRQSITSSHTGVVGIRTVNETRPVIAGVTGRKLKIKMKNSIGTYGTSIFGSTQAMTNKIKIFQSFLNDMKVNLTQTNQIVNSCINSFDSKTTMTFKMLDEVVNTSKLPSLLPNHSQTIKKNATHISALEEHNIHPDKIFTPAMLIQRREEMDKERECELNNLNPNQNRQQILTSSVSSQSYRNVSYFETNPINSATHSLNHIRRTTSANIGSGQNLYSLQTASNNQVVSRARYNLPINRQITGATVIHQQNVSQIQSTVSNITSATSSTSSNATVSQNQAPSLGSRSQSVQFQIQNNRNSSSIPRRTSNQVFQRLVYPGNMHNYSSLRQNQIVNRGSTAFVRPIVPTVVNQSNSQNSATNNSIISVFPNSHEQTNRNLDRSVNFNITGQIRGHNVRSNIATVSSSTRGNINQVPRMLHVNQITRNNMNTINRNQE